MSNLQSLYQNFARLMKGRELATLWHFLEICLDLKLCKASGGIRLVGHYQARLMVAIYWTPLCEWCLME